MTAQTNNPSPTEQSLETLQDIKRMMERSSRFISLSGLSGVSAGVCAFIGAWIARGWILTAYQEPLSDGQSLRTTLLSRMIVLALGVLVAALVTSTFFTWRKA